MMRQARRPLVIVIAAAEEALTAAMMVASAVSISASAFCFRSRTVHAAHFKAWSARYLRCHDGFVARDLVGIDFPIVVHVKRREEAISIGSHLRESELPVMVAVGLSEPQGQAGNVTGFRAEGFAHRADERAPAAARAECGPCRLGSGRLSRARCGEYQQGKQRHGW